MASLLANRSLPNTGGWQDRHNTAVVSPKRFEVSIIHALDAWELYALIHLQQYDSKIGYDGVLGVHWRDWGLAIRGLLNGETGRLDCGTLDAFILDTLAENGIETSEL